MSRGRRNDGTMGMLITKGGFVSTDLIIQGPIFWAIALEHMLSGGWLMAGCIRRNPNCIT